MLRRVNQPVGGRHPLSMFHIVLVHDRSSHVRTNYHRHLSHLLGCVQILIGILYIVFQYIANHHGCIGSISVLGGVCFLVTGIMCVVTARDRTGCSIMCMVFLSMFSLLLVIIVVTAAGQKVSGQCQLNIILIVLAVVDALAASVSIWIGGSSISEKRQSSSSAAVTQPASDVARTPLTGAFTADLPPCQMELPTILGRQPTMPAYGDLLSGQNIENPVPVISPKTPPQYTALSNPPPPYSEVVQTAPPGDQIASI